MEGEKRFVYCGNRLPDPGINTVIYRPGFFEMELDLESEVFYELRKRNGIFPYRISQSTSIQIEEVRAFFYQNRNTFYFIFDLDKPIGSILFLQNCIKCLSIAKSYQRRGLGTKLTAFAINKILDNGYTAVELNILPGNIAAEQLYRKIGFTEVNA